MRIHTVKKLLNLLLILTFQFGYLEWGGGNSQFVFQAEADVFRKAISGFENVLHPLILLPYAGILILLYTLFQKEPGKRLTYIGICCLSLLMLVLFLIGVLGNIKVLLSTLPFWIVAVFIFVKSRKDVKAESQHSGTG